jgi:histidine ammonia-lyase
MIIIGGRDLNLDDFYKILFKDEKVELDSSALKKVKENFEFLQDFFEKQSYLWNKHLFWAYGSI